MMPECSDLLELEKHLMEQETTRKINEEARIENEKRRLRSYEDVITQAVLDSTIKYHDPIEWDITTPYKKSYVVANEGRSYLSKKDVPSGIEITNEDYWQLINDGNAELEKETQERVAGDAALDGRVENLEIFLWDDAKEYEQYSIVLHQGTLYTSSQHVPSGTEITNEQFWVETGNYNAQIEDMPKFIKGFNTVADMKADSALKAGMVVTTNGYYTANDGGSALYIITNSENANEMDIIACANSLYAVIVVPDAITPIMLGANGENCEQQINRAIEISDTVVFDKIYNVSDQIHINKPVTLQGLVRANGIKKSIQWNTESSSILYLSPDVKNITLNRFTVDGIDKQSHGVHIPNCTKPDYTAYRYTTINELTVTHCKTALLSELTNYFINVSNSSFKSSDIGINFISTDCMINDVYCSFNERYGLYLSGGNNKLANIKSEWNGQSEEGRSAWGVNITGQQNTLINIECQSCYCGGIIVSGKENQVINALVDRCGLDYSQNSSVPMTPYATGIIVTTNAGNIVTGHVTASGQGIYYLYGYQCNTPGNITKITVDSTCYKNGIVNSGFDYDSELMTFGDIKDHIQITHTIANTQTFKLKTSYFAAMLFIFIEGQGSAIYHFYGESTPTPSVTKIVGKELNFSSTFTVGEKKLTLTANNRIRAMLLS